MAQKAKRRIKTLSTKTLSTKTLSVPTARNGNGFHRDLPTNRSWVPGDPIENHPLASLAGSHKGDPTWDEFIQIMKDLRREELERDLKNLEDEP